MNSRVNQTTLSDDLIRRTLEPYGAPDDAAFREAIRIYVELLLRWNQKISLTAITDPVEVLRVHFGESIFAAHAGGIDKGRLADIGSGPGFPGIPMRMVRPDISLTLVEPVGKKVAFLGEVIRLLGLTGTAIIRSRMEDIHVGPSAFDFVTARALGAYKRLLNWAKQQARPDVKIVLLLGADDCREVVKDRDFSWNIPVRVPNSKGRFVLGGTYAQK